MQADLEFSALNFASALLALRKNSIPSETFDQEGDKHAYIDSTSSESNDSIEGYSDTGKFWRSSLKRGYDCVEMPQDRNVKNREDVASLALRASQEQAALDRKQRCRGRYKCSRCGVPKINHVCKLAADKVVLSVGTSTIHAEAQWLRVVAAVRGIAVEGYYAEGRPYAASSSGAGDSTFMPDTFDSSSSEVEVDEQEDEGDVSADVAAYKASFDAFTAQKGGQVLPYSLPLPHHQAKEAPTVQDLPRRFTGRVITVTRNRKSIQ